MDRQTQPTAASRTQTPRVDMTIPEFCEAFHICRATAYKLIAEGKLRSYKLANSRRIPRTELEELPKRLLAESEAA